MVNTDWRVTRRESFGVAGSVELYKPGAAGDVLEVRQLTISLLLAAEVVVYFGYDDADRQDPQNVIRGLFLGASGGAAPDLACEGAWAPKAGLPIRLWCGVATDVHVAIEGRVRPGG